VERDVDRLAGSGEAWMLQVAAQCEPTNVERTLREVSAERLHVLPVEIGERACFRICWGPFDSREDALSATAGLPRALRTGESPKPRPVADLLR
jgi:hypothetical protein